MQQTGCKQPYDSAFSLVEATKDGQEVERTAPPEQLSLDIQWALQIESSKQRAKREANQRAYKQEKRQRAQAEYLAKLHEWAASDDAILVAEANRQLERLAATRQR